MATKVKSRMRPKPESSQVRRSRQKLMERWKKESQVATPKRLEEIKQLIQEQMARTSRERVPVPGKEDLSLYTPPEKVITLKLSPQMKALKEKIEREFHANSRK
jgi:hypothetical protein